MTRQDTISQSKSHHTEAGQGNPKGVKESQEHAKELETHPLLLLGVLQNHQANSYSTPTEDPVQTQAGPALAVAVFVSPYEPCFDDLHVLLVFFIPTDSYKFSSSSFIGFSKLQEERPYGDLNSRPSLCVMSGWGSLLHLLPSATGGSLSDDEL